MTSPTLLPGGTTVVMGIKERRFDPLPHEISLEDLVPQDNFYRRLETTLDLSFVRDMVRPLYARGGRPSVDPVVFFRLQPVMFFEGLRSERELMRVAADRLSVRWYLGYDLHEPLPDHSNLTRTRERFGLGVFRRFFEEIVEMCVEAGLVRGEDLYFDATKVDARDASLETPSHPASTSRSTWTASSSSGCRARRPTVRGDRSTSRGLCPPPTTRACWPRTPPARTGSLGTAARGAR